MHRNLRSFLQLLEREKDVAFIDAEVDPYLELAEVHRRVIAEGGAAPFGAVAAEVSGARSAAARHAPRAPRARARSGGQARAAGRAADPDDVAGGRRPVRHAAARLHGAPRD